MLHAYVPMSPESKKCYSSHSSLHASLPDIYIHIYVKVAHNFDTFYAAKLKSGMIFTQTKTLDIMVVAPGWGHGSECITGHIEHTQNGNRIINLVPLLAIES